MANNVAKTNVTFGADTKPLDKGLDDAQKKMGEHTEKMKRELKEFGKDTKDIFGDIGHGSSEMVEGLIGLTQTGGMAAGLGALIVGFGAVASVLEGKINKRLEESQALADKAHDSFRRLMDEAFDTAKAEKNIGDLINLAREAHGRVLGLETEKKKFSGKEKSTGLLDFILGGGRAGGMLTKEETKKAEELTKRYEEAFADWTRASKTFAEVDFEKRKELLDGAEKEAKDGAEAEKKKREEIDKTTEAIIRQNRAKRLGENEAAQIDAMDIKDFDQRFKRIKALEAQKALEDKEKLEKQAEDLEKLISLPELKREVDRDKPAGKKKDDKPDVEKKTEKPGTRVNTAAIRSDSQEGLLSLTKAKLQLEADKRDRDLELAEQRKIVAELKEIRKELERKDMVIKAGGF